MLSPDLLVLWIRIKLALTPEETLSDDATSCVAAVGRVRRVAQSVRRALAHHRPQHRITSISHPNEKHTPAHPS
jgi:hypothetical protein